MEYKYSNVVTVARNLIVLQLEILVLQSRLDVQVELLLFTIKFGLQIWLIRTPPKENGVFQQR